MAISDKTRKKLWGLSGNRCAICRSQLVHEKNDSNNFNLGEECHIVSSKPTGPRHRKLEDYDSFDNLILLCCNHHTEIDQNVQEYPEAKLLQTKASHEKLIKDTIDIRLAKLGQGPPEVLLRLVTGKQVVDVINSVHGYRFDHDSLKTTEEAEKIGYFLDSLKEWGDCYDLMGNSELAKLGIDLQKDLNELELMGFYVFGARTKEKTDFGILDIATIQVSKKDNPTIKIVDLPQ